MKTAIMAAAIAATSALRMEQGKYVTGEIFPNSLFLSSRGYASPHIQTNMPYKPYGNSAESGITDVDGDGVEDNMGFNADEVDKFFDPNSFNTADDVYNTRHGGYPGQRQKEFYEAQSMPDDTYSIVDLGKLNNGQ